MARRKPASTKTANIESALTTACRTLEAALKPSHDHLAVWADRAWRLAGCPNGNDGKEFWHQARADLFNHHATVVLGTLQYALSQMGAPAAEEAAVVPPKG